MSQSAEILKEQFFQSLGLPWQEILPASRLNQILEEEGIEYRDRVYTPVVTPWGMIYQVLSVDKSLRYTVKGITTWLMAAGVAPPSSDTGAYSKARGRLSEGLLQRLVPETAEALEKQVPDTQAWCGRRVKVFDGTTLLMADSAANQAAYPQHGNQAEGCGFPFARVVVFSAKPKRCPEHMSADEFETIPQTLQVTEVRLKLSRKGFRDQFIVIVTTLLDAQRYTRAKLSQLYGWRWQAAEVSFRHLKTTLKMEMLTAKTPEMVRKEIWTHLLAYNLLRGLMEQAAPLIGYARARLSLQGTRQLFNQTLTLLATASDAVRQSLYSHLLKDIATDLLP